MHSFLSQWLHCTFVNRVMDHVSSSSHIREREEIKSKEVYILLPEPNVNLRGYGILGHLDEETVFVTLTSYWWSIRKTKFFV